MSKHAANIITSSAHHREYWITHDRPRNTPLVESSTKLVPENHRKPPKTTENHRKPFLMTRGGKKKEKEGN